MLILIYDKNLTKKILANDLLKILCEYIVPLSDKMHTTGRFMRTCILKRQIVTSHSHVSNLNKNVAEAFRPKAVDA